jgi:hypothetical protein
MLKTLLASILALPFVGGVLVGQNLNDRLAEYTFERMAADDGFSVCMDKIAIIENREYGKHEDGTEFVASRDINTYRSIHTIAVGERGRKRRIDTGHFSLTNDTDALYREEREALLLHEMEGWYVTHHKGIPYKGIQKFPLKGGLITVGTNAKWKNPFNLPVCAAVLILSDDESKIPEFELRIFEEEELKDGRKRFLAANDWRYFYFTFHKDFDWCVEEIQFWARKRELGPVTREEFPKITKKEDIEDFAVLAKTRTTWKEVEKGRVVPWDVFMTYDANVSFQYEFHLRQWKFGDNFDRSVLEEENFTETKIQAGAVEFPKLKKLFDQEIASSTRKDKP